MPPSGCETGSPITAETDSAPSKIIESSMAFAELIAFSSGDFTQTHHDKNEDEEQLQHLMALVDNPF